MRIRRHYLSFRTVAILILAISFTVNIHAQEENMTVGFGCGPDGSYTDVVYKTLTKSMLNDYDGLIDDLSSPNASKQFLAVIMLEGYSGLGRIELSQENLHQIKEIKTSKETITFCSGCTYYRNHSLAQIFGDKNDLFILDSAKSWFHRISNFKVN